MSAVRDHRLAARHQVQKSKSLSRPKQSVVQADKENAVTEYFCRQKNKNTGKVATLTAPKTSPKVGFPMAELIPKKKSRVQETACSKETSSLARTKLCQSKLTPTLEPRKNDRNQFGVANEMNATKKTINKQQKTRTKPGLKEQMQTAMTEQDVGILFDQVVISPNSNQVETNLRTNRIKIVIQNQCNIQGTQDSKLPVRDLVGSVKYLEVEDKFDKLLSALDQACMVRVQPESDIDKTAKFKQRFIVGKQIGQGAYASVRVALDTYLNKKIAVKIYEKRRIQNVQRKKSVRREITILQHSKHRNIVQILDVVETNNHVNLIMQYIPGVPLSNYIRNQSGRRLSHTQSNRIFKGLVQAVTYLHGINICHRDIKLDNVLLDGQVSPKLIDFGFSTCVDNAKKVNMFCGTPSFMAPEIVNKQDCYGPPVDIWALGVVLFVMLTGVFPFKGHTDKDLNQMICSAEYPIITGLCKQSHDLIRKMLCANPDHRITGREILTHGWMVDTSEYRQENRPASVLQERNFEQSNNVRIKTEACKENKEFGKTQNNLNLKHVLRRFNMQPNQSQQNCPGDFVAPFQKLGSGNFPTLRDSPTKTCPNKSPINGLPRLTNKIYF